MAGVVVGRGSAVGLALVVIAVELALVAGLVTVVARDDGWSRVLWGAVGALLLWQLLPRPARPGRRAVPVPREQAPALHDLARTVAEAVGARAPSAIAVETTYGIALVPTGYLGRATLVLGLPQWTVLGPDERVAVLASELAGGKVWRSPAGTLVRLADDLLTSARTILTPTRVVTADQAAIDQTTAGYGEVGPGGVLVANRLARETSASIGAAGMSVLSAPVRAVQSLLHRLWCPATRAAVRDGDARAAALVGAETVTAVLLSTVGTPRGLVAAAVAARNRSDPFEAMATGERPDRAELDRRLAAAPQSRREEWHPSTADRVAALREARAAAGGLDRSSLAKADEELALYRSDLTRRFAEELVHGRP